MARQIPTDGPTSAQIIGLLERSIGETTRRLHDALSDHRVIQMDRKRPTTRVLLEWIISCSIMPVWVYFGFLRPLESDARYMEAQQLDPSQIIAIPYDIRRLISFTGVTAAAVLFQHGIKGLYYCLVCSIPMTAVMLLSGASFQTDILHSVCAAIYWSILACWLEPPLVSPALRTSLASHHTRFGSFSAAASTKEKSSGFIRTAPWIWVQQALISAEPHTWVFHSTLIATIVLQVLNILDNGLQWQRWPVPVIVGSSVGWTIGILMHALLHRWYRRS